MIVDWADPPAVRPKVVEAIVPGANTSRLIPLRKSRLHLHLLHTCVSIDVAYLRGNAILPSELGMLNRFSEITARARRHITQSQRSICCTIFCCTSTMLTA